jgi:hypothetical protein
LVESDTSGAGERTGFDGNCGDRKGDLRNFAGFCGGKNEWNEPGSTVEAAKCEAILRKQALKIYFSLEYTEGPTGICAGSGPWLSVFGCEEFEFGKPEWASKP